MSEVAVFRVHCNSCCIIHNSCAKTFLYSPLSVLLALFKVSFQMKHTFTYIFTYMLMYTLILSLSGERQPSDSPYTIRRRTSYCFELYFAVYKNTQLDRIVPNRTQSSTPSYPVGGPMGYPMGYDWVRWGTLPPTEI